MCSVEVEADYLPFHGDISPPRSCHGEHGLQRVWCSLSLEIELLWRAGLKCQGRLGPFSRGFLLENTRHTRIHAVGVPGAKGEWRGSITMLGMDKEKP